MTNDGAIADRAAGAYHAGFHPHPGLPPRGQCLAADGLLLRSTDSTVPYFNSLLVTSDGVDAARLGEGLDWFESRGLPYSVKIRGRHARRFDEILRRRGLVCEQVMPGMAAVPLPDPSVSPAGFTSRRVSDRAAYNVFTALVAPGAPGSWLTTEVYRELMPPEVVGLDDLAFFLGDLDGEPVAQAAAHVAAGVVVVFAVGTVERLRRRGIGRAVTTAAIEWGRGRGADMAYLTSSDMARSLYDAMGFRTVDTWHFYVRPTES